MGSQRVGHDWAAFSRFVITFLPRSKRLSFHGCSHCPRWLWRPRKKICRCFHVFPIYLPWSNGLNAIVLDFWVLSFKPAFSFSSFTLIKRFFSSSSLSPIRLVSSAYMRLLIFLLAILIPVCESSSLAFLMMYFAYQLNKVRVYNLEYFSYSFSLPGLVEFQPRHTHTAYYFQL